MKNITTKQYKTNESLAKILGFSGLIPFIIAFIALNFHVSKNCFRPIPKVESSVLTFIKKKKVLIDNEEKDDFIIFKRKLFSQKRKSLKNILKKYKINDSIDLNLRVENLKLEELIKLFRSANL